MNIYKETHLIHQARGTLVLVHGAGEHIGRYKWLIKKLNELQYCVIGGDLPGLGRSEGKKGHIDAFQEYYHTVDQWVNEAYALQPPVYLLGHSMGGLIVIRYLEEYRPDLVKGVILSSPCLGLVRKVSPILEGIAWGLNRLSPSLCLPSGILPEQVSKDPVIVEEYAKDPLICRKVSVRWYQELKKEMKLSFSEIARFPRIPTLVMQAGQDQIVTREMTKKWAGELPDSQCTFMEWPGLYHELFNEPEKEEVFAKLADWLKKIENLV